MDTFRELDLHNTHVQARLHSCSAEQKQRTVLIYGDLFC